MNDSAPADTPRAPHVAGEPPIDWLLDSDPALRWQVLRDLTAAPADAVAVERARVAEEGWGARLLAARDRDGQWMGGACFPGRGRGEQPAQGGQPWTATLPAMMELYDFGLDPASRTAREMTSLVAAHCRWEYNGGPFFDGEVEPCINGRTVTLGAYFGADVDRLVTRLLTDQLADGGWNCWTEKGAAVSSFHSTICVLEGLLEYERATGGSAESEAARRAGEEYLLDRSLFRRKSTGEVAVDTWLRFSFPTRWRYDVLRGLEYFRSANVRDPRLDEPIELLRSRRQADGTWLLENTHPGAVHFRLEDGDGRPSRWNTLRASRVLRWWDARG
ncbi:squalene cyclase [Actinopolymorpha sp. NPDC004070]|uniref:squalene cyclase n=1 Tax=Actinopolymorpha sp. NPDC004070 TaxID=3154548 RepID=UPI0033B6C57E